MSGRRDLVVPAAAALSGRVLSQPPKSAFTASTVAPNPE